MITSEFAFFFWKSRCVRNRNDVRNFAVSDQVRLDPTFNWFLESVPLNDRSRQNKEYFFDIHRTNPCKYYASQTEFFQARTNAFHPVTFDVQKDTSPNNLRFHRFTAWSPSKSETEHFNEQLLRHHRPISHRRSHALRPCVQKTMSTEPLKQGCNARSMCIGARTGLGLCVHE